MYRALVHKGILDTETNFICHACLDSVNLESDQNEEQSNLDNDQIMSDNEDDFLFSSYKTIHLI